MREVFIRLILSLPLLAAGWRGFHPWAAEQVSRSSPAIAALQKAIEWDSHDPEYYFKLGILHRDELLYLNLSAARMYLEKALALNPHSWQYWLELARCYEFSGLTAPSEKAYLQAVALNPRSAVYRWRLANFYLRRNNWKETLSQFKAALTLDPSFRQPALALLWNAGIEDREIESLFSKDGESRLTLLDFLVKKSAQPERQPTGAFVRRQWDQLMESPTPPSLTQAAFYIDYLLGKGENDDALQQWVRLARGNGLDDKAFARKENFIWNGDFESPITGLTLDWKLPSSGPAFTIVQAKNEGVNSSTSLRIDFQGSENLNFHGLQQRVLVEPGKTYDFSFQARSSEISTEQGLYFQILDGLTGRSLLETAQILGTRPWNRYVASFHVPSTATVLSVELRRRPSRRIDNLLRGRLWLDSVVLKQAGAF